MVLELGGSDPYIVLDDADVEKAGRMAANARMVNTGQSCIAAKRFIVMESAADEFVRHFLARLKEMKLGDPMDETTDIGTVARQDILDNLKEQLRDAQISGPLVSDAALASLALEHGATICTTDRDFHRFRGLKVLDPLASESGRQ